MSGPIVRSGPTPEFSKNWESVFGKGKKPASASVGTKKAPVKKTAKKAKAGPASKKKAAGKKKAKK